MKTKLLLIVAALAAIAISQTTIGQRRTNSGGPFREISLPPVASEGASMDMVNGWSQPAANAASEATAGSSPFNVPYLEFDGTSIEYVDHVYMLPSDYRSTGTTSARIEWSRPAGSGSNVVWNIKTWCPGAGDVFSTPNFNSANSFTSAVPTATQTAYKDLTPLTMTGCDAGETLHIQFYRDPTAGADDLNGVDAWFINFSLKIPVTGS